jgi:hypothetical protein
LSCNVLFLLVVVLVLLIGGGVFDVAHDISPSVRGEHPGGHLVGVSAIKEKTQE